MLVRTLRMTMKLFITASLLLMTVAASVSAASLQDIQGHWASKAIEKWHGYNVIGGYNGKFRPNEVVTRGEFAVMMNNIMKYVDISNNSFTDLDESKWYAGSILKLHAAGVLTGSNGKINPNNPITRQEAAVVISKSFQISTAASGGKLEFKDAASIASWAKDAVGALTSAKVMNGFPDGTFRPSAKLTRAEAVTIVNGFIQELIYEPGEYTKNVRGNLVVNTKNVILKDMSITGDLYITQGVADGDVTLTNVQVLGSVHVYGGGENSIIMNNVDVKGALVVNKYDGKIRILAKGSTSIALTKLESGALLVTSELTGGGFETVEISADIVKGQEIVLDGNFTKVVNESVQSEITVTGTIMELVAKTETKLKGDGKIEKMSAPEGVTVTLNNLPLQSTSAGEVPAGAPIILPPSGPSNPNPTPVFTAQNVFAAIEEAFIGGNINRDSIRTNLNLMTTVSGFQGVTVTWTSDNTAVISSGGVVVRDEDSDRPVKLTATLSGAVAGSREFNLTVKAQISAYGEIVDFVDSYFVEGYPQAYVKDGEIWVRYMLNAPAEVYMIVNNYNGHIQSNVTAVLRGYAGDYNNYPIWTSDWPYFVIDETKVDQFQEFNTGHEFNPRHADARIEFVIVDKDKNYVSSDVTTILFQGSESVEWEDTYPPYLLHAYLSRDLERLYLYYSERLDLDSVPVKEDYTLSEGTVENVTIISNDELWDIGSNYVLLEISGVTAQNKNDLKLSYSGTALQDRSVSKNKAETFTNYNEVTTIDEQIKEASLSSDRKKIMVKLDGMSLSEISTNPLDVSLFEVTVNGAAFVPNGLQYGHSIDIVHYTMIFDSPLPIGNISLTLNASGLKTRAMDNYTDGLTTNDVKQINAPGVPTASYQNGQLTLAFAEGYEFDYASFAPGITIKVGEVEYELRGYIIRNAESVNEIVIRLNDKYTTRVRDAVEQGITDGATVQVKFTNLFPELNNQLRDSLGASLPNFDYVTVIAA